MVSMLPFAYLHPVPGTMPSDLVLQDAQPDYFYGGVCPRTGQFHRLPRTSLAKAVARGLMAHMQKAVCFNQEGKMYGILLVQTPDGQMAYLKAFSGLLQGQAQVPGWVPPLPGREQVALQEAYTLQQLATLKQRLVELQQAPERQIYPSLVEGFDRQRQALNQRHRDRKQRRDRRRQALQTGLAESDLELALRDLEQESRGDKAELRAFKQTREDCLSPLRAKIQAVDDEMAALKRQRQRLSRRLQADMHQVYSLTNFAGQAVSVQDLAGRDNLPAGTGDCCAPKLLHFAADHGLIPLGMAEFWWGPAAAAKQPGEFYGACAERCQPIMGFLLSGLSVLPGLEKSGADWQLPILYEDDWLVVVNKPAGLLAVPGRYGDRQDSVLSRLRHQLPKNSGLVAVHRLDQATSGVLVLVRQKAWEGPVRQQFQTRQVRKVYDAILEGALDQSQGIIALPLSGNPQDRPKQAVDWQRGKPCQTEYRVMDSGQGYTRVEFYPLTGRTHQLRVHAAHPMGLNAPIRGDRLYGDNDGSQRLCLHARKLGLHHPWHQRELVFEAATPF